MNKREYAGKVIRLGLAGLLAAGIASGCSGSGGEKADNALKAMGKDEKATIKVMYYDESAFFMQYGNLFLSKYPNIDVEVISTSALYQPNQNYEEAVNKLIEEKQPDILMLQEGQYSKFASEGKLLDLESVIKQDKFDTAGIHQGILELLRSKGEGKLYGLAPEFYSRAIFYNKTLFEQHGVPYPTDQMSWEDILSLAKRFPTDGEKDKRVYGLYQAYDNGVMNMASEIGHTEGLAFVDAGSMKLTLQTDGWKKVFQTAIDAMKSKAIYRPDPEKDMFNGGSMEEYLKSNLFIAGRAAMSMDGPYFIENLNRAKEALKDFTLPDWDVVTVPVDPNHPDTGMGLSVSQIFAINAKSANQRAAWEFIRYVAGDDYAKIVSRSSMSGGMLSRTGYVKDKNGHNLEAFYKLKPISGTLYEDYQKLPHSFFNGFQTMADTELDQVLNNKKTLDDAIAAIQTKGQALLDQAKEEEAKKKQENPQ